MTNFKQAIRQLKQARKEAEKQAEKQPVDDCVVVPDEEKKQYEFIVFCVKGEDSVGYYAYRYLKNNSRESMYGTRSIIGEGGTANICKAFRIDPRTGQEDKQALPCIVKLIRDQNIKAGAAYQEAIIQAPYYRTAKPVKNKNGQYFILMELIPGIDLRKLLDNVDSRGQLFNLSFHERIRLIRQLYEWANLFHHASPATGKAIVHLDLKEDNIHLYFNPETKRWELYVLDFGAAIQLDNVDKMKDVELERGAWQLFRKERVAYVNHLKQGDPDEQFKPYFDVDPLPGGQAGVKSDGPGLAYLAMRLLGARTDAADYLPGPNQRFSSQPFTYASKLERLKNCANIANLYNSFGFLKDSNLENMETPDLIFNDHRICLASMLYEFLQACTNVEYDKRPSTDEGLNFIVTMDNLCNLLEELPKLEEKFRKLEKKPKNEKNKKKKLAYKEIKLAYEKTKTAYLAKLCVLSAGLWQTKIGEKLIDYYPYSQSEDRIYKFDSISKDKTFADFDFQSQPEINTQIIDAYVSQSLNDDSEVIETIKAQEEEKSKAPISDRMGVKNELSILFQLPRDLLAQRLKAEHLEMILDLALRGLNAYQRRDAGHLCCLVRFFDGDRGRIRAKNYKKILENKTEAVGEQHSLFTRLVTLYALLASHDGKTLQQDVTTSFKVFFNSDVELKTLRTAIGNIIAALAISEGLSVDAINDNYISHIARAMDTKSMPKASIFAGLDSIGAKYLDKEEEPQHSELIPDSITL